MRHAARCAALLLLGACAPALRPGGAPDPAALGALLRVEDRREYDAAALGAAAASAHPEHRRRAALAAGRLRETAALPLLQRLLADADTSVAATAAFALGQVGDTAAVRALAPWAAPARAAAAPTVAAEAAYALGKLRSAEARAALVRLLAAADPAAPGAARPAVESALLAVVRHPRPLPVAEVSRWLASADPELRVWAAYALSRRAEPAATAALFPHAGDPDPRIRGYVARSLGAAAADTAGIGRAAAQARLAEMAARDPDREVRINAVRTLGGYPGEESVAVLAALAEGGEPYLALPAMESLQRIGAGAAAAAPLLERIALDGARHVSVRQTALAALAAVEMEAATRAAEALAEAPEWRLRAGAARVWVQAGEDDWPTAARAMAGDGRVAAAVLDQAVATLGDSVRQARYLVLEGLRHPDPVARTNALTAIARMGETGFLPLVFDAYHRAASDTLNDALLAAVDAIAALAPRHAGTWEAFFATFPRSPDYLVRQRVAAAVGDTIDNPWGAPLPVETEVEAAEYAAIAAEAAWHPLRRARIETDRGTLEVELFHADAPLTVRNFLGLAEAGYFDGQEWPRVVPHFVIQGGDPRGDTSGGPGYSIRDEINRHRYGRGTLGMALSGPDTGGSQWFLTHAPQPHLDGTYTVFGRLLSGWEALDTLLPGDRIIRIREVP